MEFRVGQITARCEKCEGTVFEEQGRDSQRGQTRFSCARCGSEASYSELILQIGRQSASRSRQRPAAAKPDGRGVKALIALRDA
jgi:NAD-dependent SIR2 family protein deacetylase